MLKNLIVTINRFQSHNAAFYDVIRGIYLYLAIFILIILKKIILMYKIEKKHTILSLKSKF